MVWVSPCKPWELLDENERAAARWFWAHGDLRYKLDPDQLETSRQIDEFFATCKTSFERVFVLEWARRLGKDFLVWVRFRMASRLTKRDIYYYGTAYETDISDILIPIIQEVDRDCRQTGRNAHWIDPVTETQIRLIGLDKNPNGIRGNRAGKICITEASYVGKITDVFTAYKPMLTENPDAEQYLVSTPGETVTHEWHTQIVPQAKLSGGYSCRILDECKRFTPAQIEAAYNDPTFGGRDSTKSRREYRCEHVSEETKMVIPEWLKSKDVCTRDSYSLPEYAHCYTIIDPGQVHLFAFLFLLYDFRQDTVVAQKAYTLRDPTTSEVAESIRDSEHELWSDYTYHNEHDGTFRTNPFRRYSDVDLRLIKDLTIDYGLEFHPTKKDDLRSAVNAYRQRIASTKYVVLPGAKELTWHLDGGIWDTNRRKFADVGGLLGHFDLLACGVYGERNIDLDTNPLPPPKPGPREFRVKKDEKISPFRVNRDRYGRTLANMSQKEEIDPLWFQTS